MENSQGRLPPVRVLNGLSEKALGLLSSQAERHVIPPRTVFVKEEETGNRMFLIESGAVRVFKNRKGKEVELAVLKTGDCFGEGCILTTLPRMASVQSTIETVVYSLSSMAFYRLYQTMPDQYSILVLNIARELSRRLRELDDSLVACQ
jgi:CRP/FNR family cyclic AMP-dependent transcriptional regulator